MVFAELLDIIRHERNLSIDKVAEEIGISATIYKNLLYKNALRPNEEATQKILTYCEKHSIDTSELDWNEITYEYFFRSGKYSDYKWECDLDSNNNIKVEHKTCGRKTFAPISAFDGKSTLCIHCWFEKFVPESYSFSFNERDGIYSVYHIDCGERYPVTYEQIKQKKYYCQKCGEQHFSNAINSFLQKYITYSVVEEENNEEPQINTVDEEENAEPQYPITLEDLDISLRVSGVLKRLGIDDISKLTNVSIRLLRHKIWSEKSVVDILRQLDAHGIRRKDCSREQYPMIDDYIRKHMRCDECYSKLSQEGSDTIRCLCKDCVERLERVNADKSIAIEIKIPEYLTYTKSRKGLTIFANLMNKTKNPLKVKLQEITLTHRNTQKVSNFNYSGYNFDEDYLFPNTIKAIGKVWITNDCKDEFENLEELDNGDYCVIILKSVTNNMQYYYKFVFCSNNWELYDYYELE